MAHVHCSTLYDWIKVMDSIDGVYEVADDPYRRLVAMRNLDLGITFTIDLTNVIDRPRWGFKSFPSHLLITSTNRAKLAKCLTTGNHDFDWSRRSYIATFNVGSREGGKPHAHLGNYRVCRQIGKMLERFAGVAMTPTRIESMEGHLVYNYGHVGKWELTQRREGPHMDLKRIEIHFLGDPHDLVQIERDEPEREKSTYEEALLRSSGSSPIDPPD